MFIRSKILSPFSNLLHGFTARQLGDDYPRIAKQVGISVDKIITLKQIHSNKVHLISEDNIPRNMALEGDALVTDHKNIVVGIRTADCIPILIYDAHKRIAAAIHAGWKGLIVGVIENTALMMKELGSHPADWVIAVGPSICGDCFEVGPEVVEKFEQKFGSDLPVRKGRGDRSFLDLRSACHRILLDLSIPSQSIETLPYCTVCHNDLFYSYRKGDSDCRNLSFIGFMA